MLGREAGYPAGANLQQAYQQPYLVGSFSAMDSIAPSCRQAPAAQPVPLPAADPETTIHYRYRNGSWTLDDYMAHQRATAVVVVKDGRIVAQRFNYGRTPQMRMLSNSMAKTVVALGILKALELGKIASLDDHAEDYVPALKGTLYGRTQLVNLLRMASGARFTEDYTSNDDRAIFVRKLRREGTLAAVQSISERAAPEGERFNYAGAQTSVLGLVLQAATGQDMCQWIGEQIWQPMGAAAEATWLLNPVDQQALAQGGFNATVYDYARLGMLLANDGVANGQQVIAREHVLAMTDPARQPPAFRPGVMLDSHGRTYLVMAIRSGSCPAAIGVLPCWASMGRPCSSILNSSW